MEIKNTVIINDQASAKLKQIAKAAQQATSVFKKFESTIRNFNNLQVNTGWTKTIQNQNRMLNQQLNTMSRIYHMSRMIGRFNAGVRNGSSLAPINLTSAIAMKIRPIDLNGRIRIRGLSSGGSSSSGSSGISGGSSGSRSYSGFLNHLGGYYMYREIFNAVVGLGRNIAAGVNWVSEAADRQIKGQYKLGLLTPDIQETQKAIYQSALRSRVSYQDQLDDIVKMATSAPGAFASKNGKSIDMNKAIMVTETFNKIAKLSGATQEETSAARLQFKQSLSSNKLAGDELRSLKENMPMFINYLAQYMTSMKKFGEVSTGQIKELGRQGKLTADVLVGAMEFAKKRVDEQYKNLPMSVGEAMTQVGSQLQMAMTPVSTMFGRIFNGNFFKPFFDAFDTGFATLQTKLKIALGILSGTHGGQAMNSIQQVIQNIISWFGDLAIKASECARWVIKHWSQISELFRNIGAVMSWFWGVVKTIAAPFIELIGWLGQTKAGMWALAAVISGTMISSIAGLVVNIITLILRLTGLTTAFRIARGAGSACGSAISWIGSVCASTSGQVGALGGRLSWLAGVAMKTLATLKLAWDAGKTIIGAMKERANANIKIHEVHDIKEAKKGLKRISDNPWPAPNLGETILEKTYQTKNKHKFNNDTKYLGNQISYNGNLPYYQRYYGEIASISKLVKANKGLTEHQNKVYSAFQRQKLEDARADKKINQKMAALNNVSSVSTPSVSAPSVGAPSASDGRKAPKHSSPANKVQKVEVVNPVKLEEKYKDLLYSEAASKWASWYGNFHREKPNQVEQPINITINGNINSDEASANNLLNKIRGGIAQAARQKLWGPQRTF